MISDYIKHIDDWNDEHGVFVDDMPEITYHAHQGSISKSGLDRIAVSPAHYMYGAPKKRTRAMTMGTAIHAALLEPERFDSDYICLSVDKRTASEYKEAVKANGGDDETVLTAPEADNVKGMRAAVYAQAEARKALERDGFRELSAFATDPETGVMVRCRYDLLTTDGRCLDLKKTRDARAEEFSKAIYNYRYMVQAALYSDVYYWITGEPLKGYGFLAVEEDLPHTAQIYILDDEAMELGRRLYRRDLNRYAECLQKGEWPGYGEPPKEIGLPGWAVYKLEQDIGGDEDDE